MACSTSTSVLSGSVDSLNPSTASLTPSAEGKEELVAPTKDGELLPRSLDLTVTQVLYRSAQVEEPPDVALSHLRDPPQPLAATRRGFTRREPDPCRKVTSLTEALHRWAQRCGPPSP